MLAIGRALVTGPKLLPLDEPTEGLAPVIVDRLLEILQELKATGLSMLLGAVSGRLSPPSCTI